MDGVSLSGGTQAICIPQSGWEEPDPRLSPEKQFEFLTKQFKNRKADERICCVDFFHRLVEIVRDLTPSLTARFASSDLRLQKEGCQFDEKFAELCDAYEEGPTASFFDRFIEVCVFGDLLGEEGIQIACDRFKAHRWGIGRGDRIAELETALMIAANRPMEAMIHGNRFLPKSSPITSFAMTQLVIQVLCHGFGVTSLSKPEQVKKLLLQLRVVANSPSSDFFEEYDTPAPLESLIAKCAELIREGAAQERPNPATGRLGRYTRLLEECSELKGRQPQ